MRFFPVITHADFRHQRHLQFGDPAHQLREALEIATHVALIRKGQIAYAGVRIQEMVDDTGWLYRHYEDN